MLLKRCDFKCLLHVAVDVMSRSDITSTANLTDVDVLFQ